MSGRKEHRDFGPVFWAHLASIVIFYLSPFLIDWRLVVILGGLLVLHWRYFGGCLCTIWEFGKDGSTNFNWYYLNRLGFRVSLKRVCFFTDYVIPLGLFTTCLVWQVVLGHEPWLVLF